MCVENSHRHENSKDNETTLGICNILDKGEKGEDRVLDFRSENGQFIGS